MDVPVGRVRLILIARRAGEPMQCCDRVEAEAGLGLVGDRYHARLGHWSDPKWPDQELTLIEAEVAGKLGVSATALRRNIVTEGIDLQSLIGRRFRFGSQGGAVAVGVRPCDPCSYIEGFTRPGMLKELADGNGGLRSRVIVSGAIRAGDAIYVLGGAG